MDTAEESTTLDAWIWLFTDFLNLIFHSIGKDKREFRKKYFQLIIENQTFFFFDNRNGVATVPASEITIMTLKNPNMPTVCDDRTKQDFESLMADQYSGDVYLAQKNIYGSDVSLYKVCCKNFTEFSTSTKQREQESGLKIHILWQAKAMYQNLRNHKDH